jgi:hypothetical protein
MQGIPRGGLRVQTLVALLVTVVALAMIVVRFGTSRANSAAADYAEVRIAFAPDSLEVLGRIDDVLPEASGLAVSRRYPGITWANNDSGDEARFFAVDSVGIAVATFDVAGVEARDWESMDIGPCPGDPVETCLFLADTGDNVRRRDVLTIYVVPEPDPAMREGSVEPLGRLRYLYPSESRDAEAMAVSPTGELVIVTKGRAGNVMLFSIVAERVREAVADDEPLRLGPGIRLPIEPDWGVGRVVTGASFRPDGAVLAVRTLSEIYFYGWPGLEEAAPPCFLGKREPQGEAVGWEDRGSLLLMSETTSVGPGMLLRVWCGSD